MTKGVAVAHAMIQHFDPSSAPVGGVREVAKRFHVVAKYLDRVLPDGPDKDRALHGLVTAQSRATSALVAAADLAAVAKVDEVDD